MKPTMIVVAMEELKEADMEVIRAMEVCPSCGTEGKSGEYWHLMCYRCKNAVPQRAWQCVDRQPPAIMPEQFVFWMKLLGRTHVFLAQRGEVASEKESLPGVAAPISEPFEELGDGQRHYVTAAALDGSKPSPLAARPPPPGQRQSSRRGERALEEAKWETIWREGSE